MRIFVFPGQGSQSKGMGGEFFDQIEEYRAIEAQVDELMGYSMRELCLNDPNDELGQTQFTQPALYVVNALHYYDQLKQGNTPDYVAGHSLGEYNALLASGAFDFLTGLKLVKKRGQLMAQAKDGGMAAIIGVATDEIANVLAANGLQGLDVANFNSPSQTVISGPVELLEKGAAPFKEAGAKLYKVLPVSAAFHSRYMQPAADEYTAFLQQFSFGSLTIPVIANFSAQPYTSEVVTELLSKQISGSVQWTQSVMYLKGLGEVEFAEVGPGNVLTKLIKQIS